MARIRTIKPEFWTSQTVSQLTLAARLTFIGLWNYADDYGVAVDDARLVKAAVWPLNDAVTPRRVEGYLSELEGWGLILRYEAEGRRYLHVRAWEEHQPAAYRRGDRVHPAPPDVQAAREDVQAARKVVLEQGTGNREQGTGNREQEGRDGGSPSRNGPVIVRKRDLVFEALCESYRIDWRHLPDPARDTIGTAAAALTRAGATPEEVRRRAEHHQASELGTATPSALVKHWGQLEHGPVRAPPRDTAGSRTARTIAALEAEGR